MTLRSLKSRDEFMDLSIGDYYMDPMWWHIDATRGNEIPPIYIVKKTRQPTMDELDGLYPIDNCTITVGVWLDKNRIKK